MRFLFVTISIYLVLLGFGPAQAGNKAPQRIISMNGLGEMSAKPDIAYITSGVTSQAETAGVALERNSRAMRSVIDQLKTAGIADIDIQTSSFSVQPQYFYDKKDRRKTREIIGYQVTNQVTVTVRNLNRLGRILDAMVKGGANKLGNIRYSIAKPQALLNEARKRAMANAIDKARLYTQAANIKLGVITSINEGSVRFPQRRRSYAYASEMAAAKTSVPVQMGTQKLSIRVNVTWALE